MIAKFILTAALATAWLYTWTQASISRVLRGALYALIGAGIYFVWYPEESTYIANALGIGRGADLILYVWIVLSFGVILNIHLKLRQNLIMITELVRHMAMAANPPGAKAGLAPPTQEVGDAKAASAAKSLLPVRAIPDNMESSKRT